MGFPYWEWSVVLLARLAFIARLAMGKTVKKAASCSKSGPAKLFAGKSNNTLIQKKEASAGKQHRRKLERKSTETIVEECVRDNFKDWGSRVDTVLVDGVSLRIQLCNDIRLK